MSSKVQLPLLFAGMTCAALLALLPACRGDADQPTAEERSTRDAIERPVASRFGAPYAVVFNETPAAPDTPPGLTGDTLAVTVRYEGGCADHDFGLDRETARDTTRLWLTHEANGEDCTEIIFDDLLLPLPGGAPETPTVVLLNPQGGEPFMLSWSQPPAAP